MKRKTEFIIYAIIFCLFGFLFVGTQSFAYLYYSLAMWIAFGVLMFVSRYLISPGILNRQLRYSIALLLIAFIICFLITGYFSARYLSEMFQINSVSYLEKVLLYDTIPYLLVAVIIGLLHLFNFKRILYWLAVSAIIAAIGFFIKYLIDTSYEGDDEIVLLNSGEPYTSLQDIVCRPDFKNKIIYIDIWSTTCGPCLNEFKQYTPQLVQRYKNSKDVAFLYICIDSHPFPEMRWKEKIEKFKPGGYHILVEASEEAKLSNEIFGTALEGKYFPYVPCYLIVGRDGEIIEKPTINEGKMELRPSDTTLLYNKLDSLRQL